MASKKDRQKTRWTIKITIWTLVIAAIVGFIAQFLFSEKQTIVISFIILMFIVFIGIIFDLIGTAAAAAEKGPVNARATRKAPGAKRAVHLVKNAEKVANICCDVVGDISGVLSGALATVIVTRVIMLFSFDSLELYVGVLLTAIVAAITVGGKSWGKTLAVNKATEVIMIVGFIISRFEKPLKIFRRRT